MSWQVMSLLPSRRQDSPMPGMLCSDEHATRQKHWSFPKVIQKPSWQLVGGVAVALAEGDVAHHRGLPQGPVAVAGRGATAGTPGARGTALTTGTAGTTTGTAGATTGTAGTTTGTAGTTTGTTGTAGTTTGPTGTGVQDGPAHARAPTTALGTRATSTAGTTGSAGTTAGAPGTTTGAPGTTAGAPGATTGTTLTTDVFAVGQAGGQAHRVVLTRAEVAADAVAVQRLPAAAALAAAGPAVATGPARAACPTCAALAGVTLGHALALAVRITVAEHLADLVAAAAVEGAVDELFFGVRRGLAVRQAGDQVLLLGERVHLEGVALHADVAAGAVGVAVAGRPVAATTAATGTVAVAVAGAAGQEQRTRHHEGPSIDHLLDSLVFTWF
jgi:hypothetical protein